MNSSRLAYFFLFIRRRAAQYGGRTFQCHVIRASLPPQAYLTASAAPAQPVPVSALVSLSQTA